ncbi:MAG: PAS domain S-box protein [Kovacikia sp.]
MTFSELAQDSSYPSVEDPGDLDGAGVDGLTLILEQVDDSIALFSSSRRLVRFNQRLVELWNLPIAWLQSHPHWNEILDRLIDQGQLIDLQVQDIQWYLEHAQHKPRSFRILQADGCYLEMRITATAETNVLLVIKHRKPQEQQQPERGSPASSTADEEVPPWMLQRTIQRQADLLHRSEQQLRTIFENTALGIGIISLDQRIIETNPALQQLLGYSHEELYAVPFVAFTHPEDGVIDRELYRELITGQRRSYQLRKRLLSKDGQVVWVRLTVGLVYDPQGRPEFAFYLVENGTPTELVNVKQQLMAAASRWGEFPYRQMVETAMEGIWVIDASSQTTFVNQMMADMLGYSIDEMIGTSMFEFMDEAGQEIAFRMVERRRQGIQERHDFKFQRRDGSDLWTIISTNPLFDEAGQYRGALGMLTDITERKQWEDFLKQANEQLGLQVATQSNKVQEALLRLQQEMKKRRQAEDELRLALDREKTVSQLKSYFVSMVSHEFGNPLTAILTASQLLEYTNPCEDRKAEYLRIIQESVDQMSQLMEDVLLIGKSEAEKVPVEPTMLDLNLFCCRLLGELRLSAGKNYHLQMVNLCADSNVYLDAKLLRQILCNLLSNAIKYSPHCGTIQLEVMRQDNKIIFQVQDEGIGIPEKDLPHLFESFNRAGNVGKIPGTGLGLAIVKHCVDALGGQILVSSEEDKGTTFRVLLPIALPPHGALAT